jgi:hypothetical protein
MISLATKLRLKHYEAQTEPMRRSLFGKKYEQLVFECYWTSRSKEKMTNNRYRFFYIHCKDSHKDKNTTSYHKMYSKVKIKLLTNTSFYIN